MFDGVEVLDFAGPFEVFSRTRLVPGLESRRSEEGAPFRVMTISQHEGPITATGGLVVQPEFTFESAPAIDLLLIPGGFGTRPLIEDATVLDWIRARADEAQLVTSVCSGSLLLAAAGLLGNRRATTHASALDRLNEIDPTIEVVRDRRFVVDGMITSAGVAAGIDMAFSVVERLHGKDVADETARYIEYPRPSSAA
jgi:transcriptional regulator GlxA family with amidase domain